METEEGGKVERNKRIKDKCSINTRVGDVKAGQVVGRIAEEVKQGVARCRHYFWNGLITSRLWYN